MSKTSLHIYYQNMLASLVEIVPINHKAINIQSIYVYFRSYIKSTVRRMYPVLAIYILMILRYLLVVQLQIFLYKISISVCFPADDSEFGTIESTAPDMYVIGWIWSI